MLTAHDDTKLLRGGHAACGGCMASIWPLPEGTRADAERELVDVRGWEIVEPDQVRCVECRVALAR